MMADGHQQQQQYHHQLPTQVSCAAHPAETVSESAPQGWHQSSSRSNLWQSEPLDAKSPKYGHISSPGGFGGLSIGGFSEMKSARTQKREMHQMLKRGTPTNTSSRHCDSIGSCPCCSLPDTGSVLCVSRDTNGDSSE